MPYRETQLEYIEGPLLLLLLLWARVMTAGVYPVEYWMAPLSFHDDSLLLYKVSFLIFLSLLFFPSIHFAFRLYKGGGNHGDHHHHLKSLESFSSSPFCWRRRRSQRSGRGQLEFRNLFSCVCVCYTVKGRRVNSLTGSPLLHHTMHNLSFSCE